MALSGCEALAPCASIETQLSAQDMCRYDISRALGLGRGKPAAWSAGHRSAAH